MCKLFLFYRSLKSQEAGTIFDVEVVCVQAVGYLYENVSS